MRATPRQLAQALTELLHEHGEKRSAIEKGFFEYLRKHRLLGKSDKIMSIVENYLNEKEGRLPVLVSTAHPLGEGEKKKIEHAIKTLFPAKHFLLSYSVKPALLGGIRIETENDLYDATLRRHLTKLAHTL